MRVGHVPLLAVHEQAPGQRAAPADFDGVAQGFHAGRLTDDAVIDLDALLAEPFHDLDRAMHRRAFLVRGNQQADGAFMLGMFGHKILNARDKRGQRGLHVSRATAVQVAVAHLGLVRVAFPGLARAGGDDIGMPGEHHQRLGAAAHGPQVLDIAEGQALDIEAERCQALDHDFLAAFITRRL